MTATNPAHAEPPTLEHPMLFQGLDRVLRTTGEKSATIPQHRADRNLIATDQPTQGLDEQRFHAPFAGNRPRSRSISPRQFLSCCRNSFRATDTGRFNRKTTSQGKLWAIINRNASLAWRFMAFRRFAARASRFGTISPNRDPPAFSVASICRSKLSPRTILRAESTAANSLGWCRRDPF